MYSVYFRCNHNYYIEFHLLRALGRCATDVRNVAGSQSGPAELCAQGTFRKVRQLAQLELHSGTGDPPRPSETTESGDAAPSRPEGGEIPH